MYDGLRTESSILVIMLTAKDQSWLDFCNSCALLQGPKGRKLIISCPPKGVRCPHNLFSSTTTCHGAAASSQHQSATPSWLLSHFTSNIPSIHFQLDLFPLESIKKAADDWHSSLKAATSNLCCVAGWVVFVLFAVNQIHRKKKKTQ